VYLDCQIEAEMPVEAWQRLSQPYFVRLPAERLLLLRS
jgi:hypothetical protein